jgi:hypothetical protein
MVSLLTLDQLRLPYIVLEEFRDRGASEMGGHFYAGEETHFSAVLS